MELKTMILNIRAIAAVLFVALFVSALYVNKMEAAEPAQSVAGAKPCEEDCAINFWSQNGTFYCYPGGAWTCPLYESEP